MGAPYGPLRVGTTCRAVFEYLQGVYLLGATIAWSVRCASHLFTGFSETPTENCTARHYVGTLSMARHDLGLKGGLEGRHGGDGVQQNIGRGCCGAHARSNAPFL